MKMIIPDLEPNSSIQANWKTEIAQRVILLFVSEDLTYKNIDEILFNGNSYHKQGYNSERILKSLGITPQFKGLFRGVSLEQMINSLRATNQIQYLSLINILRYKNAPIEDVEKQVTYTTDTKLRIAYSITDLGLTENQLFMVFNQFKGNKISILIDELNTDRKFDYFSIHKLLMDKYPYVFTNGSIHAIIKLRIPDIKKKSNLVNKNVPNKIISALGPGKEMKSISELDKTGKEMLTMFNESRGMSVSRFIDKLNINDEYSKHSIHKVLVENYGNMFTSESIYASVKSKLPETENESIGHAINMDTGMLVNSIADLGVNEKQLLHLFNKYRGIRIGRIIDELNSNDKFNKYSIHQFLIKEYGHVFSNESYYAKVKMVKIELTPKIDNAQAERVLNSLSELKLTETQFLELIKQNRGKKLKALVNEIDKEKKFNSISVCKLLLKQYPQYFTSNMNTASVRNVEKNKEKLELIYSIADLGISEEKLMELFEKYEGKSLTTLVKELDPYDKLKKISVYKFLLKKYSHMFASNRYNARIKKEKSVVVNLIPGLNLTEEQLLEKISEYGGKKLSILVSDLVGDKKVSKSSIYKFLLLHYPNYFTNAGFSASVKTKTAENKTLESSGISKVYTEKVVSSIDDLGITEDKLFDIFNSFEGKPTTSLIEELNKDKKNDVVSLRRFLVSQYPYAFTNDDYNTKVKTGRISVENKKGKTPPLSLDKIQNIDTIENKIENILKTNVNKPNAKKISVESNKQDVVEDLNKKAEVLPVKMVLKQSLDNAEELTDAKKQLVIEIKQYTGYSKDQTIELMKAFNGKELTNLIKKMNSEKQISDNRLKILLVRLYPNEIFKGYIVMDNVTRMELMTLNLVNIEHHQSSIIEQKTEKIIHSDGDIESLERDKIRPIKTDDKPEIRNPVEENRVKKTDSIKFKDDDLQKRLSRERPINEFIQEVLNGQIILNYKETVRKIEEKHGYTVFLSKMLLQESGYKRFGRYILKSEYRSPEQAIRNYIKNNRVTNVERSPFSNVEIFRDVITKLENNREIYEITPNHYIADTSLQSVGINRRVVNDFVKKVEEFVSIEKKFFTIYSLTNSYFSHPLLDIGFENYFYEKLIKMNSRILQWIGGKEIIFYKTLPKRKLLLADFFMWHIEKEGIMDYQDLINLLLNSYGVEYTHHVIKQNVEKRGAYYSTETEKFYVNKKLYYQEVYY